MNAKPLTEQQLQKDRERRRILEAALPLLENGESLTSMAHKIGTSAPTLSRLFCKVSRNPWLPHLECCKILLKYPIECLATGYHVPLPLKTREETAFDEFTYTQQELLKSRDQLLNAIAYYRLKKRLFQKARERWLETQKSN